MKRREPSASLFVNEIFLSLQGETTTAGFPSVFVRLAGCNLECAWCDTPGARAGGTPMGLDAIRKKVSRFGKVRHVTITGGEPLAQEHTAALAKSLLGSGHHVQVETNGSILFENLPPGARIIADVKTPSSGHAGSFIMRNLELLKPSDELKFVIADRKDYLFAVRFMKKYLAKTDSVVNLSPVSGRMRPEELARLILRDRLRCRLNLQLHTILWPKGEPKDS